MFIIVCASTQRSSVRVACAGPREARAKMLELEQQEIGKVRAFDAEGRRLLPEQLAALIAAAPPDAGSPADVDGAAAPRDRMKTLIAESLCGSDLDLDGLAFSLHEVSQLAASLRPGAFLTLRNSHVLSPIEQASIASVMPGQIRFA